MDATSEFPQGHCMRHGLGFANVMHDLLCIIICRSTCTPSALFTGTSLPATVCSAPTALLSWFDIFRIDNSQTMFNNVQQADFGLARILRESPPSSPELLHSSSSKGTFGRSTSERGSRFSSFGWSLSSSSGFSLAIEKAWQR